MNASARRAWIVGVLLGTLAVTASIAGLVYSTIGEPRSVERADAAIEYEGTSARAPGELALVTSPSPIDTDDAASALDDAQHSARAAAEPIVDEVTIHGHVELPDGTALDADARIVRHVEMNDKWLPATSFSVPSDGRFEVSFPRAAQRVYLDFRSRTACVESLVRINSFDPATDVVLHTKRASGLSGRLRLDPGIARDAASFVGARITAHNARVTPGGSIRTIETRADEQLAFEIDGLDPDSSYELRLLSGERIRARSQRTQVMAGKRAEVELEVPSPTRLSGRVLDPSGAAVADVDVNTIEVYDGRRRSVGRAFARTRDDGSFEVEIYEGALFGVRARKPGFVANDVTFEPLDPGESRANLLVVLERGPTVTGRVTWPDGTPARDALIEVTATYERTESAAVPSTDYVQTATTGDDGRFRVSVSSTLPVAVRARASRSGAALTSVEQQRWHSGPDLRSSKVLVRPGESEIVLALQENASLMGVVVDDRGVPVRDVTVSAIALDPDGANRDDDAILALRSDASSGEFAIRDLSRGMWWVHVALADGSTSAQRVVLPNADRVRFEIARSGSIWGVVVDAAGAPAAGADVSVRFLEASKSVPDRDAAAFRRTTSDERGRFAFERVPAGPFTLSAQFGARSAEARGQLAAAETQRDVHLVLH